MNKFWATLLIGIVVLSGCIVVPLYFVLGSLLENTIKIIIVVMIGLFAAFLYVVLVWLHIRSLHKPINNIIYEIKGLESGRFKQRIKITHYDKVVQNLVDSINNIAVEFENLEDMRRSFVANASHELRSPLTSIQGFLQAMLDGVIESEQDKNKYIKIMYDESIRLTKLINGMLDLSRMEAGRYPLYKVQFDINTLIKEVIEKLQTLILKRYITVATKLTTTPVMVYADKSKIDQVIINLLDNAIKYSPEYSKIEINTYIQNKKVYILIKDQGFGIAKKDQPLIWDKFYMVDKARTPGTKRGTGLGLSIVKKIITDHKEVVWVESEKGQGAKFFFTLPIYDPLKHTLFGTPKNVNQSGYGVSKVTINPADKNMTSADIKGFKWSK